MALAGDTSAVRDFDLAREEELRRINCVMREAWDAWERSKKPSQALGLGISRYGFIQTATTVSWT